MEKKIRKSTIFGLKYLNFGVLLLSVFLASCSQEPITTVRHTPKEYKKSVEINTESLKGSLEAKESLIIKEFEVIQNRIKASNDNGKLNILASVHSKEEAFDSDLAQKVLGIDAYLFNRGGDSSSAHLLIKINDGESILDLRGYIPQISDKFIQESDLNKEMEFSLFKVEKNQVDRKISNGALKVRLACSDLCEKLYIRLIKSSITDLGVEKQSYLTYLMVRDEDGVGYLKSILNTDLNKDSMEPPLREISDLVILDEEAISAEAKAQVKLSISSLAISIDGHKMDSSQRSLDEFFTLNFKFSIRKASCETLSMETRMDIPWEEGISGISSSSGSTPITNVLSGEEIDQRGFFMTTLCLSGCKKIIVNLSVVKDQTEFGPNRTKWSTHTLSLVGDQYVLDSPISDDAASQGCQEEIEDTEAVESSVEVSDFFEPQDLGDKAEDLKEEIKPEKQESIQGSASKEITSKEIKKALFSFPNWIINYFKSDKKDKAEDLKEEIKPEKQESIQGSTIKEKQDKAQDLEFPESIQDDDKKENSRTEMLKKA